MHEIIEYENRYEEQLRKLWIDICVGEFGFEDWLSEIKIIETDKYEKMLIAITGDTVIGSMGYVDKGNNIAEIKRVYIYSEYRGTGLAQKFLEIILEELIHKGYRKVVLQTWKKFNRAISFYSKNEFELIEQKGDCYIYERDLSIA